MSILKGLRVVDFGQWIAGPLAAMMLADQGAEVIHIDPPGGPRWNSPANATLNRGKDRLTLDLKTEADRDYARRLVSSSDILIENFRPGVMNRLELGADALSAVNPALIFCSMPGFATDDPRSNVPAWEGILGAATGTYWNRTGDKPNFTALTVSSCFGALSAAISVVMALIARERDGLGQQIEVPLFDATFLAVGASGLLVNGRPEGGRPDDPWIGNFATLDGRRVRMNLASPKFIRHFAEGLGRTDWIEKGYVAWPVPSRLARGTAERTGLQQEIVDILLSRTGIEWEAFARQWDIPLVLVRDANEWIETEQAQKGRIVTALDDPEFGPMLQPAPPVRFSRTPWQEPSARPAGDVDRNSVTFGGRRAIGISPGDGIAPALEGVKVLDLTQVLAGPTAARTLAEFGAEVVKINNPREEGAGYRWNVHRYHTDVNRGKETILVDLKSAEGKDIFWRLAQNADVVLQNFRLGVADRLGVGYEQVKERQPDVVYGTVSFYGLDGPWELVPGYEPNAQAATEIAARQGGALSFALNDYSTGLLGAFGLALAIFHRKRTGEGQHVATSLAAAGSFLQIPYLQTFEGKKWNEPAGTEALGWSPLQRLYRAADGWMFLGIGPEHLEDFATMAGLGDLHSLAETDQESAIAENILQKPIAEWEVFLAASGGAAQRIVSPVDLMADKWVVDHGLSVTRSNERGEAITTIGPPPRLSRTPVIPGRLAPAPGSDGEAVLRRIGLGDEVDRYVREGVVALE